MKNSKKLNALLSSFVSLSLPDITIHGLALDSRSVSPGDVFFACKGTHVDGKEFIDDVIKKGVVAVVMEGNEAIEWREKVPVISITDLTQKMGWIAAIFYNQPSQSLSVIGVTGTNGKTSCSHFIARALHHADKKCAVIGTIGNGLYGQVTPSLLTTPDAISLQKMLAEFVTQGAKYVAMEVSSHSLDQKRVNGVDFSVGIFTNLTRDHLDYHETMDRYGAAKKALFDMHNTQYSVINADDEFGRRIIAELHTVKPVVAYGTQQHSLPLDVPYVSADQIILDLSGIRALITSPWGQGELYVPVIGDFNISNLLAVLATLCLLGMDFHQVIDCMAHLKPVDGRMQTLGGGEETIGGG